MTGLENWPGDCPSCRLTYQSPRVSVHTTCWTSLESMAVPVESRVPTGTFTGVGLVMSVWTTSPRDQMPFTRSAVSTAGSAGASMGRAGRISPFFSTGRSPMYVRCGFPSLSRARERPRPTSSRKSTLWGRKDTCWDWAPTPLEPHAAASSPRASREDQSFLDTAAPILTAHSDAGANRARRALGAPSGVDGDGLAPRPADAQDLGQDLAGVGLGVR